MDLLPDLSTLSEWLVQYGSISLFFLLTLGIIAFPVPEETLMVVAGTLIRHGKLSLSGTFLAAYAGSICGISMSYVIGRFIGLYFITKYGKWVGLSSSRLQKAHQWFEKFGKWTLFFGYFIPGVRHFTGLTAGATKMEFKHFAAFAYAGAFFWATSFLLFGYFFGHYGLALYEKLELTFDEAIIAIVVILVSFLVGLGTYHALKRKKTK